MVNKQESPLTYEQQVKYTYNNSLSNPQEQPNPPAEWQHGKSHEQWSTIYFPNPNLRQSEYVYPQPDVYHQQDLSTHQGYNPPEQNYAGLPQLEQSTHPYLSTNEKRSDQVYPGSTPEGQPTGLLFQPQSIHADPYGYKEQPSASYPHNLDPLSQQEKLYLDDYLLQPIEKWSPPVETHPTTGPVYVNPPEQDAYTGSSQEEQPNEYLPHQRIQTQIQIDNFFLENSLSNDLLHEQSSQLEEPHAYGHEQLETKKTATNARNAMNARWAKTTPEQRSEEMKTLWKGKTAKQKSQNASKAGKARWAKTTPEQRSKEMKTLWKEKTPEQRSEHTRNAVNARWAKTTPEQRSEYARNIAKARWAKTTPEQRSEEMKRMWSKKQGRQEK